MYLVICHRSNGRKVIFTHQKLGTAKGVMRRIQDGTYGPHDLTWYTHVELVEVREVAVLERIEA